MKTLNIMNLQRFAEPVQGAKILYLIRIKDEAAQKNAEIVAFQTEGTTTITKDADSTATKDGSIRTPAPAEIEISLTALLAKGDTVIDRLKAAMLADKLLEVWEIDASQAGTTTDAGKFKGTYYQGYLTSCEKASSAEDFVEMSLTFGLNGTGVDGYYTLSQEQQEAAQYAYTDTVKATS